VSRFHRLGILLLLGIPALLPAQTTDTPTAVALTFDDLPMTGVDGGCDAAVAWETEDTGRALYFSRARIPHGAGELFHHVGIYGFTRAALAAFHTEPTRGRIMPWPQNATSIRST